MKHCLLCPLLIILLLNISNAKELKIKASLFSGTWFSTSNKYYIVDANNEEFEEIIKNCPDCIAKYNSYNEKEFIAITSRLLGGIAMVWSVFMEGLQSSHGYNPEDYSNELIFLSGTTLVISSFFVQSSALNDIEEIAPIYNKAQSKQTDKKRSKWEYGLLIGENKVMIGFSYTF